MKMQNPLYYFTVLIGFLKETKVEGKRVNWPSRDKTIKDTIIVIAFAVVVAAFLSSFDYLFQYVLNNFLI
ncbi:MAG TPA: preprotein translocase subunit SecE [Candidatus Paceibacterota bacterium]